MLYHNLRHAHLVNKGRNSYGPRQQMKRGEYGVLNYFMRRAMLGEPLTVFGDGEQLRSIATLTT